MDHEKVGTQGAMVQQKADINQRIWQVVALIPRGKVSSYGEVARQAGLPGAARRVGYALRCLPTDTRIPWHRVIGAQGRLSLPAENALRAGAASPPAARGRGLSQ